jgi:hypothetical protein
LMYNLQIFKHLTCYTDSEWESNLNGLLHYKSLHWLCYLFVTVAHLTLLIRMECISLYSLAFSCFLTPVYCVNCKILIFILCFLVVFIV